MKEKDIVKHLQLLRSVEPDVSAKRALHKKVLSRITVKEKSFGFFGRLFVSPLLAIELLTAVLIFFVVVSGLLTSFSERAIVDFKIAAASNQYEKAKIALAYLYSQITNTQNKSLDNKKFQSLSYALTLSNTQMSELKLVGEKGKYTSQQCLELYESYHEDLQKIDATPAQTLLGPQVKQDEKQSEKKLEMYDKKYHPVAE